jgi:hypothetical protein
MAHFIQVKKGAALRVPALAALVLAALCFSGCPDPNGEVPGGPEGPPEERFYTVTLAQPEHGSISADKASAAAGELVTLTVTWDAGYDLTGGSLRVNNGAAAVKPSGGAYAFTMPAADVTVSAWIALIRDYDTLEDMAADLAGLPQNTADTPYLARLGSGLHFGNMGKMVTSKHPNYPGEYNDPLAGLFAAASGRYVAFDLRGISKDGSSTEVPARPIEVRGNLYYVDPDIYPVAITLPSWVTKISGYSSFAKLTNLRCVNLEDTAITEIGGNAFVNTAFTSLTLPATLTTLNSSVFEGNASLLSVDLSRATLLTEIPFGCFRDCPKLRELSWPPNLETLAGTALDNTGFVSLAIPATVKTLGAISDCANLVWLKWHDAPTGAQGSGIANCGNLVGIEYPASMTSISSSLAFNSCSRLETVIVPVNGVVRLSKTFPFGSVNPWVKVYVPDNQVAAYKNWSSQPSWRDHWDKIAPLSALPPAAAPENWL